MEFGGFWFVFPFLYVRKHVFIVPKLNRHEFEQALGVSNDQGSLACCSPWGHKELDTNEQLNGVENFTEIPTNLWIHIKCISTVACEG